MTMLNIGSGQRRFEGHGWVNIDCVSRSGQVPDIVCDVLKERLPFEDNSVDLVALVHTLEHWELSSQDHAIGDIYRVLKPGGSVIIIIPDIRALAQRWLARQISDYIYSVNLCGAYQGEEGDFHRWHHTRTSLREKLVRWGWTQVKEYDWRAIPGMDVSKDWWYWGAEAVK